MNKLSSKILQKIKKEKVTPRPRWYFILMHTLLGTAILTSIIIGGIAVAIVIRHFTLTDWELARQFAGGHVRSFFLIIPYIWLIFIGLTIFLADLLFKHTKKGHRIELWKLVAASVALSIIFGSLFYFTKTDQPIEEGLRKNLRPYEQWENKRNQIFVAPEKGVLAGEIVRINQDEEWIVVDFKDKKWLVDISDAMMRGELTFEVGMRVGMIGEMIDQDHFKAKRIGPWKKEMRPLFPPKAINMKINERKF